MKFDNNGFLQPIGLIPSTMLDIETYLVAPFPAYSTRHQLFAHLLAFPSEEFNDPSLVSPKFNNLKEHFLNLFLDSHLDWLRDSVY